MKLKFLALCLAMTAFASCTTIPAQEEKIAHSPATVEASKEGNTLIPEGWREVVISVSDLDSWVSFYTDVLGWEMRASTDVPRQTLSAWGLPQVASAKSVLMANPKSGSGYVRILDIDGVPQERIRSHDQAWESGGIYNFNVRANDIAATSKLVTEAGWQAPSDPVKFTFGPFIVWEWVPRHWDGVRMAFIERVKPTLEGWPNLKTTSRTFNSTQIVSDMDEALAFYKGVLGFGSYLEDVSASKAPGEHVLGLSKEAMTEIVRDVRIINPQGKNEGSVELLAFNGYSGRDFSDRAKPPNLGVLMLRFPVPDVEALAVYFEASNVALAAQVTDTVIAPYGAVRTVAVQSPDGAWMEFFETLDK